MVLLLLQKALVLLLLNKTSSLSLQNSTRKQLHYMSNSNEYYRTTEFAWTLMHMLQEWQKSMVYKDK
jgi:hypothetical protein